MIGSDLKRKFEAIETQEHQSDSRDLKKVKISNEELQDAQNEEDTTYHQINLSHKDVSILYL